MPWKRSFRIFPPFTEKIREAVQNGQPPAFFQKGLFSAVAVVAQHPGGGVFDVAAGPGAVGHPEARHHPGLTGVIPLKQFPVEQTLFGKGSGETVLGGAAGNLFDRLAYGYVIDMLEPLFARLFVFNPADAAVVCGAVLLGVYLLFGKEDTPDERA